MKKETPPNADVKGDAMNKKGNKKVYTLQSITQGDPVVTVGTGDNMSRRTVYKTQRS